MRATGVVVAALILAVAVAVASPGLAADPAATRPQGKLDADRWARRNIELLRWAVDQPERGRQSFPSTVLGFSLQSNPLLMRDPYAAEVAALVEAYQKTAGGQAEAYDRYLRLLRMPEAERLKHLPLDRSTTGDAAADGAKRPPRPYEVGSDILNLPRDARAAREPAMLETMESAARELDEWGELALAYWRLATFALREGPADKAGGYIDRMLQILREHPIFQDPNRGNTDAVAPSSLAELMLQAGRRGDLEQLIEAHRGEVRTELAAGLIAALASRGDFDAARVAINKYLAGDAGARDVAGRLGAALDGKILLPPPAQGDKRHELPPAEARLRGAQSAVATGFAARGDVDTAGRMHVELQRDDVYHRVGKGRLTDYAWSSLAMRAAEAGHAGAARRAFEHAIESMKHDTVMKDEERDETARLVREAVAAGAYKVADRMLSTSGRPGAGPRVRLAEAHRLKGNVDRARALLDEALKVAYERGGKEGAAMAAAAVELQALGDERRAESVLLDALGRIEGVDFGISGTAAVVAAAVKMNRLDLLEKIYERSGQGERLLLCIVASGAALYGVGEDE